MLQGSELSRNVGGGQPDPALSSRANEVNHPSELRPIALLEPTGKITLGLVTKAIQQQLQHFLHRLPQFAYAGGRGTDDAIHRLANHCRLVRQKASEMSYPLHRQRMGMAAPSLLGGMTLCLDLTRAFDMVDRSHLFAGLISLGVTTDIISLCNVSTIPRPMSSNTEGLTEQSKHIEAYDKAVRQPPCLLDSFHLSFDDRTCQQAFTAVSSSLRYDFCR